MRNGSLPSIRVIGSLIIGAGALLVTACGGGSGATSASSGGGSGGSSTTISAAQTSLGSVLAGPNGNTVYVLVDSSGKSIPCTGGCLSAWPPVTMSSGSPQAGSGVTASLATTPQGGSTQATANGNPLYYYSGDSGAGQTNGQGIKSFGGVWYAVQPNGQPMASSGSSGSNGSPSSSAGGGY